MSRPAHNRHPLLSNREWLHDQYVTQGKSANQIAGEIGTWNVTVFNWLHRHEIPTRPRGYFPEFHRTKTGYVARGYAFVPAPEGHPHAHKGFVPKHRHVMEQHLGRYLEPQEQVHHKNRDKLDNRLANLELMSSNAAHRDKHMLEDNPHRILLRDRAWLQRQLEAGLTYRKIGELAGCTDGAVCRWIKKHNLPFHGPRNQYVMRKLRGS